MLLEAIGKRRSIRVYSQAEVNEGQLQEIIRAVQFAPTARNSRAVELVVVKKQETKAAILAITGQDALADADILLVPAINTAASVAPVQDLSIASAHIFIQAAGLGLGTLWKNVVPEQAERIRVLLGIPEGFLIINVIPVGSPKAPAQQPHTDAELDPHRVHREKW